MPPVSMDLNSPQWNNRGRPLSASGFHRVTTFTVKPGPPTRANRPETHVSDFRKPASWP